MRRSRRRAIAQRRHADLAAAAPPEPAHPPTSRAGSPAGAAPASRTAQSGNDRRLLWGLGTLLIGATIASCAALAVATPDSSFALSKP
jgi:hypothetical protein